jgi:DNA-damage-inducible protein J
MDSLPSNELQCSYKLKESTMPSNAVVRARIDEDIKDEASAVLASMGLTVSDALRMMLTRVAREHSLPFDPLVPNATTVKAMREARRGKTTKHKSLEDLMADLHADD